ncbi:MAG: hypothetical protein HY066_12415 [Betaproteobacteria bacterium]|nr:hypothetical protein [Betaproteobacteria bacterium]
MTPDQPPLPADQGAIRSHANKPGAAAVDDTHRLIGHILPTSATMVGVCVTAIGIVRLLSAGTVEHYVDKLLAIDSVLFVICSSVSFAAIRMAARAEQLESIAESLFMAGLFLLGIASVFMAFQVR